MIIITVGTYNTNNNKNNNNNSNNKYAIDNSIYGSLSL